jgi:DNA polymerase-3 subunit beta
MFKTDKAAFGAALSAARSIVKATNTIPILQNLLIERDGDFLTARGGNLDMEICARCQASFTADFRPFTCSAARLEEIVRNAPDSAVTVEAADEALTAIVVRSGRSRLKLPTLAADAFPILDAGEIEHQFTIGAEILNAALRAVAYAADTDAKTRGYLCGVHFDGEKAGLNLVATDGKRIERRLIPAIAFDDDDIAAGLPKVIVMSETVTRIGKLLDGAEDATVGLSVERIRVTVGDVVLTSKLFDGVYPDWRRLIPSDKGDLYKLPVKPMCEAIGRVMIVNGDGGNGIRLTFEDGSLAIEARDMQAGDAREDLAIEFEKASVIGFHGRQLRDVLEHMKGDTAELHITEPRNPALIHPVGDPVNLTILLPMIVKGFFDGR